MSLKSEMETNKIDPEDSILCLLGGGGLIGQPAIAIFKPSVKEFDVLNEPGGSPMIYYRALTWGPRGNNIYAAIYKQHLETPNLDGDDMLKGSYHWYEGEIWRFDLNMEHEVLYKSDKKITHLDISDGRFMFTEEEMKDSDSVAHRIMVTRNFSTIDEVCEIDTHHKPKLSGSTVYYTPNGSVNVYSIPLKTWRKKQITKFEECGFFPTNIGTIDVNDNNVVFDRIDGLYTSYIIPQQIVEFSCLLPRANPKWSPNGIRISYIDRDDKKVKVCNKRGKILAEGITDQGMGNNLSHGWLQDERYLLYCVEDEKGVQPTMFKLDIIEGTSRPLHEKAPMYMPRPHPRLVL